MEGLASPTGLLPEQSWDESDIPEKFMWFGRPTGSAMPLMWAHAEYVKLLRSTADGKVYDLIPEVAERYIGKRPPGRKALQVWKPIHQVRFMKQGETLRVQGNAKFRLHWSSDNWNTTADTPSSRNSLEIEYVDLPTSKAKCGTCFRFTFLWTDASKWEGEDYNVTVS